MVPPKLAIAVNGTYKANSGERLNSSPSAVTCMLLLISGSSWPGNPMTFAQSYGLHSETASSTVPAVPALTTSGDHFSIVYPAQSLYRRWVPLGPSVKLTLPRTAGKY